MQIVTSPNMRGFYYDRASAPLVDGENILLSASDIDDLLTYTVPANKKASVNWIHLMTWTTSYTSGTVYKALNIQVTPSGGSVEQIGLIANYITTVYEKERLDINPTLTLFPGDILNIGYTYTISGVATSQFFASIAGVEFDF